MKKKIVRFFVKQWLFIWIAVTAVGMISFIGFAEYTASENSYMKRVVVSSSERGMMLSSKEIVDEVNKYPVASMVVLTGGEPSLFIDEAFVAELKQKTGKKIAIETNGTRPLPSNLDWVTFSPKTAFEGGDFEPCVLKRCDELKVVYLGQDLAQYDGIEAKHRFLQPCFCEDEMELKANMKACVEAVMQNPDWRLSLQIHRILNIR